uniref:Uncharacterized protein n=1 Tax=Arundo donax TaxID=35708 RepID=A0A0A8YEE6_ARUDO
MSTRARAQAVASSSSAPVQSASTLWKQRVVALSSCEAEYVAATFAACQGVWLARLLGVLIAT